ncbi:MAG: hypothetical protein LBV30_10340 [Propionibacteriaceae bacterium]|jgi:hypothetical protein|nr:hypothetical protein [Propionibacteriaceae bacterium]
MTTTYPIQPGSLTADDARYVLADPTIIGDRIAKTLGDEWFPFTAALLKGREALSGGAGVVFARQPMTGTDKVAQVAAGGEYPISELHQSTPTPIFAVKAGTKARITDEALGRDRYGITAAINDALTFLGNGVRVNFEASSAKAVADAKIPNMKATAWTGADALDAIFQTVLTAFDKMVALRKSYAPSMIAVTTLQWAKIGPVIARANGATYGTFPTIGIDPFNPASWFVSSDLPKTWQPTLIDPNLFGGVAHETVPAEGYSQVGAVGEGFEVKTYREENRDSRIIQVRKTDVPYIANPDAALAITDTGL